jgi:outer membrane receptor protein involved in Fe transport
MHFLPWQPLEENGHSSAGLRATLQTQAETVQLTSGIDVEYTDGWLKETQDKPFVNPELPAGVHYDYQVDATTAAAYAQFSWSLTSTLDLNLGARFEYNEYDYSNRTGDGPACPPEVTGCRFFRPADRSDSFSNWNFNAGLNWLYSDNHRVYARLAHGFRAPQATELYRLQAGQQVADLDAEELDSAEIGIRGLLADTLNYDISSWFMRKDEVIFQDADRQNVSGAKTRHYGVDLALSWELSDNAYAGADVGWGRHTYDSPIRLIGSSGDIEGNDIDTAPRTFGSARIGWLTGKALGRDGRLELEWVYMDSYYLEPDNRHEYAGHTLFNVRFSTALTERLSGAIRATNLLDRDYAERADFGFGQYRYFVGEPRGVYVQLEYQFGGT